MENAKRCAFCGIEMHSIRSTRRFCSDRCRYLAFNERISAELNGNLPNANDNSNGNLGDTQTVNANDNNGNDEPTSDFSGDSNAKGLDSYQREGFPNPNSSPNGNLTEDQTLIAHSGEGNANAKNGNPEPFADFSKGSNAKSEDFYPLDSFSNDNSNANLDEDQTLNTYSEQDANVKETARALLHKLEQITPAELERKDIGSNAKGPEQDSGEENYAWMDSAFLTKLENMIEASRIFYLERWDPYKAAIAKWVTTRFRTLLECTLKLSFRRVPHEAIEILAQKLASLTGSYYFSSLPADYNYTDFILELKDKMAELSEKVPKDKPTLFVLSEKRRIEMIFMLQAIGRTVPKMKLEELGFD